MGWKVLHYHQSICVDNKPGDRTLSRLREQAGDSGTYSVEFPSGMKVRRVRTKTRWNCAFLPRFSKTICQYLSVLASACQCFHVTVYVTTDEQVSRSETATAVRDGLRWSRPRNRPL